MEIAERCLDDEPKKRPTMAQVVLQLEIALEQQDIVELLVPKEITIAASCTDLSKLSVGEKATWMPSNVTNNQIDSDIPPHRRKEGREASSYKPSLISRWNASWNKVTQSRNFDLFCILNSVAIGGSLADVVIAGIVELATDALMKKVKSSRKIEYSMSEICEEGINLPKFDWAMIAFATNHFSSSNKVGEGRDGPVYRAVFPSGQIVAVKRLSASRNQNLERKFFKEILMVQKLQHPNILKLLGYCVHKENMIPVHEFMEKKSLEDLIFEGKFQHVQWAQRFKIIMGIARGVAYLHHDLGTRIVHRDLKLSHILLGIDMNPKVSGFGLAKTVGECSCKSITTTVSCGTISYVCPEYCPGCKISTMPDVYSFGVVVLEIVSGRKGIHDLKHIFDIVLEVYELVDESNRGRALTQGKRRGS